MCRAHLSYVTENYDHQRYRMMCWPQVNVEAMCMSYEYMLPDEARDIRKSDARLSHLLRVLLFLSFGFGLFSCCTESKRGISSSTARPRLHPQ